MTCGSVHELVNSGNQEGVLWACFVEVCLVNADPPFSIWFFNHNYICKPFGVVNFPDKLGCEQLPNLFIYGCVSFWIELSALLNDWFVRGIHVEPMDYD